MGLYMHDNGFFYIRVQRDHRMLKFSTKTKDRELAKEIYNDFLKELSRHQMRVVINPSKRGINLKAVRDKSQPRRRGAELSTTFAEYLETCRVKGYAEKTLTLKSYVIKRLQSIEVVTLDQINQDTINRYASGLTGSSDYRQENMKQLKAFLNFAIKRGYFSRNEYSKIDFPKYKKQKRDTVIKKDDFKLIFDTLYRTDTVFYYYLLTLYHTVTRPTEAIKLRVSDFDLENKTVRVLMGKTNQIKTAYLTDEYIDKLKLYINEYNITDHLFPQDKSREFFMNKFAKLRKRLNLNPKYNLYTFRHTAITDIMTATSDIEFAARQAGNSPELAIKHYVHRNDQHYRDLINKVSLATDR